MNAIKQRAEKVVDGQPSLTMTVGGQPSLTMTVGGQPSLTMTVSLSLR